MKTITVLAIPGCPHADLATARLREAIGDRGPGRVEVIRVSTLDEAERFGMTGSPTILIDGADPFAVPGGVPSLSCRLYRTAAGVSAGVPDVAALRAVLG